jgi:hypothetical protein
VLLKPSPAFFHRCLVSVGFPRKRVGTHLRPRLLFGEADRTVHASTPIRTVVSRHVMVCLHRIPMKCFSQEQALCLTLRIQSAALDLPLLGPSKMNRSQGLRNPANECLSKSKRSDSRASSFGEGQV